MSQKNNMCMECGMELSPNHIHVRLNDIMVHNHCVARYVRRLSDDNSELHTDDNFALNE